MKTLQSDEALIRLTIDQGSQYFGQLVKRYADYVYGIGMRLSCGNDAQAKDVSQLCFFKAFKYLASFNPNHQGLGSNRDNRFRNWLTGIAVNCYSDLAKNETNTVELTSNSYEPHVEQHDPREEQESDSEFNYLIRSLTTEERQLVTLKFVYEFTNPEIAGMLKMNAGTVKSKISRALARLREANHEQS